MVVGQMPSNTYSRSSTNKLNFNLPENTLIGRFSIGTKQMEQVYSSCVTDVNGSNEAVNIMLPAILQCD